MLLFISLLFQAQTTKPKSPPKLSAEVTAVVAELQKEYDRATGPLKAAVANKPKSRAERETRKRAEAQLATWMNPALLPKALQRNHYIGTADRSGQVMQVISDKAMLVTVSWVTTSFTPSSSGGLRTSRKVNTETIYVETDTRGLVDGKGWQMDTGSGVFMKAGTHRYSTARGSNTVPKFKEIPAKVVQQAASHFAEKLKLRAREEAKKKAAQEAKRKAELEAKRAERMKGKTTAGKPSSKDEAAAKKLLESYKRLRAKGSKAAASQKKRLLDKFPKTRAAVEIKRLK